MKIRQQEKKIPFGTKPWFSKCVPWASSISVTRELVRNAGSQAPRFGPPESDTLGVGPRDVGFNKPLSEAFGF